jgi:peptidyl-prolyl cis-trans isomerase SurA
VINICNPLLINGLTNFQLMKNRILLTGIICCFVALVSAQTGSDNRTLFTVGNDKVQVSEFEYVYTKNNVNNQADFSEKSLTDYLNLYENFRLKVKEAEYMKLDTIKSLMTELDGYRKQLAKTYLTDREISDKLIEEAYNRSLNEVNASHILVKCDENANPADTLAAFKKAMNLRSQLTKGADFAKIARENSDDPSAKTNDGSLGWLSVFQTVYPFESGVYNLKPGEISMPVRTQFGYHIIKLNNIRPAQGEMHTAHLMLKFPEKATPEQQAAIGKRIDSVYQLIATSKMSFDDAVKNFSDDRTSKAKGGELPWFGTGRMVPEYEAAAFALKNDGDVSKPVQTSYGWHIIKRLEKKSALPFAEVKNDMKKKVERDSRSQVAKSKLVDRIKKENNFMEFAAVKAATFKKIDTTLLKGNWKVEDKSTFSGTLFTLAGKNYTAADFVSYVEKINKRRNDKGLEGLLNEYYDGFVNQTCLEYEESMLETKKPEFKALMKEYRDGILLFELMDRMVWSKAVKDTAGLDAFHETNKMKYLWANRADVVIFNCNDEKICNDAYKLMQKGKTSPADVKTKLNKEGSKAHVSTIEGKYEKGQYDVVDNIEWKAGLTPIKKLNDSSYQFILVKAVVGPEPKSLKEAKGYVVSDYQEYLEKTWLESLRKKYPITVDQAVFRSLIKK